MRLSQTAAKLQSIIGDVFLCRDAIGYKRDRNRKRSELDPWGYLLKSNEMLRVMLDLLLVDFRRLEQVMHGP